jgi:hypothetical protein
MVKRKLNRSEALEEAAEVHEAGHAFLAWDLDIPFSRKGVTIPPQGERNSAFRQRIGVRDVHLASNVSGSGRLIGWRDLCTFVSLGSRHSHVTGHPASKTDTEQRTIIKR